MSIGNIQYFITGDCSNNSLGSFEVTFTSATPDTTVYWISPNYSASLLDPYANNFIVTGLSAGTYVFQLGDSSIPQNLYEPIAIYISTGTCVSMIDQSDTFCGLDNGYITAEVNQSYGIQLFYLYNFIGNYISSGQTALVNYTFSNLSADTYYVIADNGGGCTGRTSSCIIRDSQTFDFDLYVVNNSSCTNNKGKLFVTDLTGINPFSYTWSNGETGVDFITGLTDGTYSLTIEDGNGCSITKSATVSFDDPIGTGLITVSQPTCFNNDGQIIFTITGGTAPFYFSGSNGYTETTFLDTITFTGLSPGIFSILVTDAGYCTYTVSTQLQLPNSFSLQNVVISNSSCNQYGKINITLNPTSGLQLFTYNLYDSSGNLLVSAPSSPYNYTFVDLSGGTYNYTITDNNVTPCVFSGTATVTNTDLFTISAAQTGTTCALSNGSIEINVNNTLGVLPFTYQITGGPSIIPTFVGGTAHTFTNLITGNYNIKVKDASGCEQLSQISVTPSQACDFFLNVVPSLFPSASTVTAYITQGQPPFTLYWSSNVNGQTGFTISNLSAGTYSLTVVDNNGCTRTRFATITSLNLISGSDQLIICKTNFSPPTYTKTGILQMFINGYEQLTSGSTNCVLNSANFIVEVIIDGVTYTSTFFTTTNFNIVPTDNSFGSALETLLESIYGIGNVTINYTENLVIIETDCDLPANLLAAAAIEINVKIDFDISCESAPNCCGIISEDGNVPPEGPNYCIITEDGNSPANEYLIIESD